MSSDYSPPVVVKPTPGGAAGDGSMNGALTVQASQPNPPKSVNLLLTPAGAIIIADGDGNTYIVNPSAGHGTSVGMDTDGTGVQLRPAGYLFNLQQNGFSAWANLACVSPGLAVFRGIDDRTSLTAVDGAAITVYAVPATTGRFRITVGIQGRGGTITSAIYTLKYTLGGAVVTRTVSLTAVDTEATIISIPVPDASTDITGQLTTLTGTYPVVDVCCLVEGVGSGT